MAKEYIERETLITQLNHRLDSLRAQYGYYDAYTDGFDEAVDRVEDTAPAADVVEVVRCKDCKYFWEYNKVSEGNVEGADGDCYFRLMCSVDEQFNAVRYCDFCSQGERKEQR